MASSIYRGYFVDQKSADTWVVTKDESKFTANSEEEAFAWINKQINDEWKRKQEQA